MERVAVYNSGKVREATLNGKKYLVARSTLIVPGVLSGSQGALYYPPDEVAQNVDAWNGMPLVLGHPTHNGAHVSARSPEVVEKHGLGYVFNATIRKGRLVAESWFDVEQTARNAPQVLNRLRKGQPVELSTGLFTINHPAGKGAVFNGKAYQYVARSYRPDHLAILVDQPGACSLKDGCGVLAGNSVEIDRSGLVKVAKWLAKNGAMPGYGQVFVKGSEVWYVGGDGDEWAEKDMPIKKFGEVPGVSNVRYEAEYFPKKGEGWKQVHPNQRDWSTTENAKNNSGNESCESCTVDNAKSNSGNGRWITTDADVRLFLQGGDLKTKPGGKKVAEGRGKSKKKPEPEAKKSASGDGDEIEVGGTKFKKAKDGFFKGEAHTAPDELSYRNYKHNRQTNPEIAPARYQKVFGKDAATFEARYRAETSKASSPVKKTISDKDWDDAVAGLEKSREAYRKARKAGKKGEAKSRLNDARKYRKILLGNASTKMRADQLLTLNVRSANDQSTSGDTSMTKKDKMVRFLTANCECWKGKDDAKTLAALPEEKLKAMVDNARRAKESAELVESIVGALSEGEEQPITANELPTLVANMKAKANPFAKAPAEEEEAAGEEPAESDMEEMAGKKPAFMKSAKKKGKYGMSLNSERDEERAAPTLNEWLESAPPEVRSVIANAQRIERKQKLEIVAELVGNSRAKTKADKEALHKFLMAKPLDELQTLNQLAPVARKPEPAANALPDFGGYPTDRTPDYSGLGEVEEFAANEADEDDTTLEDAPLGIPTVNWAEEAKLALPGRERGK